MIAIVTVYFAVGLFFAVAFEHPAWLPLWPIGLLVALRMLALDWWAWRVVRPEPRRKVVLPTARVVRR